MVDLITAVESVFLKWPCKGRWTRMHCVMPLMWQGLNLMLWSASEVCACFTSQYKIPAILKHIFSFSWIWCQVTGLVFKISVLLRNVNKLFLVLSSFWIFCSFFLKAVYWFYSETVLISNQQWIFKLITFYSDKTFVLLDFGVEGTVNLGIYNGCLAHTKPWTVLIDC